MKTQEEEDEIYRLAEIDAAEVYERILESVSPEIGESISHVLQHGSEKEVEELTNGLWELFKNK
jgi:hypothetical protein